MIGQSATAGHADGQLSTTPGPNSSKSLTAAATAAPRPQPQPTSTSPIRLIETNVTQPATLGGSHVDLDHQ
jgi:hypothetical protein